MAAHLVGREIPRRLPGRTPARSRLLVRRPRGRSVRGGPDARTGALGSSGGSMMAPTSRIEDPSVVVIAFQDPVVEEHREHLLDEERVALGGLDDLRSFTARVEVGAAQQVLGHLARSRHRRAAAGRGRDAARTPRPSRRGCRRGRGAPSRRARPGTPASVVDHRSGSGRGTSAPPSGCRRSARSRACPAAMQLEETPSRPEGLFHREMSLATGRSPRRADPPRRSRRLRAARRACCSASAAGSSLLDARRGSRRSRPAARTSSPPRTDRHAPAHRPRVGLGDELLEQPGLAGPGMARRRSPRDSSWCRSRGARAPVSTSSSSSRPTIGASRCRGHALLLVADGDEPIRPASARTCPSARAARPPPPRPRPCTRRYVSLAEEDLHRRRVLLQPRGDVHGVARHQPVPDAHVAGHHLTGVDARSDSRAGCRRSPRTPR